MTKTKENKKETKKEVHVNGGLIKHLKPFDDYLEEYTELTLKASEILIKGPKYADKKKDKIKEIYTRLSELVILLEVSQEMDKIRRDKENE